MGRWLLAFGLTLLLGACTSAQGVSQVSPEYSGGRKKVKIVLAHYVSDDMEARQAAETAMVNALKSKNVVAFRAIDLVPDEKMRDSGIRREAMALHGVEAIFGATISGSGYDRYVTTRWGVPIATTTVPVNAYQFVLLDVSNGRMMWRAAVRSSGESKRLAPAASNEAARKLQEDGLL